MVNARSVKGTKRFRDMQRQGTGQTWAEFRCEPSANSLPRTRFSSDDRLVYSEISPERVPGASKQKSNR